MMKMKNVLWSRKRQNGFTLIELLIVLVILLVLMALLLPMVFRRFKSSQVTSARLQIQQLESALELYRADTNAYPLPEQGGLDALINKPAMTAALPGIPQNTVISNGMMPPQSGFDQPPLQQGYPQPDGFSPVPVQPGNPQPNIPSGFAPQGQTGINGPGMNPNTRMGDDMTGGMNPNMGMDGGMTGGMNPNMGMDGGMTGGMNPNMGMDGGITGGMNGGMNNNTMNAYNAQKTAILARRAALKWNGPYWPDAVIPNDPWNKPYHYEYPTVKTPDGKPAIWSEGPDEKDGTDDDVANFDLAETQLLRQSQQQQQSQGTIPPDGTLGNDLFGGSGNGTIPQNANDPFGGMGSSTMPPNMNDPFGGAGNNTLPSNRDDFGGGYGGNPAVPMPNTPTQPQQPPVF
ncbi:MAG: type II secretion system protein GspG [Planctomycetaceae bacterium]|jgi:prepilin-type N-terminal cleavage/methylation domain-containing protein|nr:type II secretion system protein GspG [Planctomycetaceae bacterium]